jgi:EAL domain-containing protein (putative c-di-GMP-specific phosphodiesterase class I)
VSGLGQDDRYLAIVRTVTSLAHALDMAVTAEGIETAEQLSRLRQAGCDKGQGYYFFRPLKAEAMGALLENRAGSDVVIPLER